MDAAAVDAATMQWWAFLCGVSLLNVAAWLGSGRVLERRRAALGEPAWAAMRLQWWLAAGYVLGCAYRSVFPVFDVQRLAMVDSWLSSVLVGRSVATVAELCFAAQWALLARGLAQSTGSTLALVVSRVVVPMIVVAEVCSWHSVLSTVNLGHVIEESLWGLCVLLLVATMVACWRRCAPQARPVLALAIVAGTAYVLYMFHVDVPMYWSRWLADLGAGRVPLGVAQGLADASSRWVVTHRWDDWASEVVWMSLYFSVAVWFSIGMIHAQALWPARRAPVWRTAEVPV